MKKLLKIFLEYKIENDLDEMFSPQSQEVELPLRAKKFINELKIEKVKKVSKIFGSFKKNLTEVVLCFKYNYDTLINSEAKVLVRESRKKVFLPLDAKDITIAKKYKIIDNGKEKEKVIT